MLKRNRMVRPRLRWVCEKDGNSEHAHVFTCHSGMLREKYCQRQWQIQSRRRFTNHVLRLGGTMRPLLSQTSETCQQFKMFISNSYKSGKSINYHQVPRWNNVKYVVSAILEGPDPKQNIIVKPYPKPCPITLIKHNPVFNTTRPKKEPIKMSRFNTANPTL